MRALRTVRRFLLIIRYPWKSNKSICIGYIVYENFTIFYYARFITSSSKRKQPPFFSVPVIDSSTALRSDVDPEKLMQMTRTVSHCLLLVSVVEVPFPQNICFLVECQWHEDIQPQLQLEFSVWFTELISPFLTTGWPHIATMFELRFLNPFHEHAAPCRVFWAWPPRVFCHNSYSRPFVLDFC